MNTTSTRFGYNVFDMIAITKSPRRSWVLLQQCILTTPQPNLSAFTTRRTIDAPPSIPIVL
jgi:hypothetical protein